MATDLPIIVYTNRDFNTVKVGILSYIETKYVDVYNDYLDSDLGIVLIDVVAYNSDIASYVAQRTAEDMFMHTARRRSAILSHAKGVGYRPRGPKSASVVVTASATPLLFQTESMYVPKGALVVVNNLQYELIADALFNPGDAVVLTLQEGVSHLDIFQTDNSPYQKLTASNNDIAEGSWEVSLDGVIWTSVEDITLRGSENVYSVEYADNNVIVINFGNGITGNKPNGEVTLSYRVTKGALGKITTGAINAPLSVVFSSGNANSIIVSNSSASEGGESEESNASIRVNSPAAVRTQKRAVTPTDYVDEVIAYKSTTVSTASQAIGILRRTPWADLVDGALADLASAFPGLANHPAWLVLLPYLHFAVFNANIIDIYVWTLNETTGIPESGSPAMTEDIQNKLRTLNTVTTVPYVLPGKTQTLDLDLGIVYIERDVVPSNVESDIRSAITEHFASTANIPGGASRISVLYDAIQSLGGVSYFTFVAPSVDITPADSATLLIEGTVTMVLQIKPDPSFVDPRLVGGA